MIKRKIPVSVDRDYLIRRLLELPQLIAETNNIIIGLQERIAWQENVRDQLQNEFVALQTIAKLL